MRPIRPLDRPPHSDNDLSWLGTDWLDLRVRRLLTFPRRLAARTTRGPLLFGIGKKVFHLLCEGQRQVARNLKFDGFNLRGEKFATESNPDWFDDAFNIDAAEFPELANGH